MKTLRLVLRSLMVFAAVVFCLAGGRVSAAALPNDPVAHVHSAIGVPGQQDRYQFTLPEAGLFHLDALLPSANLYWTLVGPAGTVVPARGFDATDAAGLGNSVLVLGRGDYLLTVAGNGDAVGDYDFRFVNFTSAQVITPGVVVAGTLSPGTRTDLFQFPASSGDVMRFRVVTPAGLGNARVAIVDPYGTQLVRDYYHTMENILLPRAGTYTLLLEGQITAAAPSAYSFAVEMTGNIPQPPLTGAPALLGATISGAIATPGETDDYLFTLGAPALVVADSMTDNSQLTLTLTGVEGVRASGWRLYGMDADRSALDATLLRAGDYQVRIQGSGAATGPYSFRILDLATAVPFQPGVTNFSTNTPASSTRLFQFQATAGQSFYMKALSTAGFQQVPVWRVLDPNGHEVRRNYFNTDMDLLTLSVTGPHTLLIEGEVYDAAPSGTVSFVALPVVDGSQPLPLGQIVTGAITPGQRQVYTFTLSQPTKVLMDSFLDDSRLKWSLSGPSGLIVNRRGFDSSDSERIANPTLSLPPGDYVLTVDGNGDLALGYRFRLLSLASAPPLALDTQVNGVLPQTRGTALYQFEVSQAGVLYLDLLSYTGFANQPTWRLIDPYGRDLYRSGMDNSGRLLLSTPGTHTLSIEGAVYDGAAGSGAYSFVARTVSDPTMPLAVGTLTSGTLAVGQIQHYGFTLPQDTRLIMDVYLDRTDLRWTLTGPNGVVVNRMAFGYTDAERNGNPVLSLVAGSYDLQVAWDGDLSGPYSFRLVDLASAAPITPGVPVTGTNTPARAFSLHKFSAATGDLLFFDRTAATGFANNPFWQLFDPYGRLVFATDFNDVPVTRLTYSGTYTLAIQGRVYDVATSGAYGFTVIPVTDVARPLVLGDLMQGTLPVGEHDTYTFHVSTPTMVSVDALVDEDRVGFSLLGPTGYVYPNHVLRYADADRLYSVVSLVPGDYTATLYAGGDQAIPYSVRLVDHATAAPMSIGSVVTASLAPANSTTIYRFQGQAGDRVLFNPLGITGLSAFPTVRVLTPNNGLLYSFSSTPSDPFTLPATGLYTVVVEGVIWDPAKAGTFSFVFPRVQDESKGFSFGDLAAGTLTPGQMVTYPFVVTEPKMLVFDSYSDRSDVTWSLTGSSGTVRGGTAFGYSDGSRIGNSSMMLLPGSYQVLVDGYGLAAGDYAFRLLDSAAALPMSLGTTVSGLLHPARQTAQYAFTASEGDWVGLDAISSSGFLSSTPTWRLVNQYGQTIVRQGFSDVAAVGPLRAGAHTLYLEGEVWETGTDGAFSFKVSLLSNTPPAVVTGTPLLLGQTVAGTLSTAAEQDTYRFTIGTRTRLHWDNLTADSSFRWTLDGPNGRLINNRGFSDGELQLDAYPGDFVLTVFGNGSVTGDYKFRILDLAQALPLVIGQAVTNTVSPGNIGTPYRFDATNGQRIYLQWLGRSGFQRPPWIQLVDPYGNLPINGYADGYSGIVSLVAGHYTFLVLGLDQDTAASGTFQFQMTPVVDEAAPLALGTVVSGSIDSFGGRDTYSFTLPTPRRLYFDTLTNVSSISWALDGPYGRAFNRTAFSSGDQLILLPAGDYRITVDADATTTGGYRFRLFDPAAEARPLSVDVPFTTTNSPANSASIYRFDGVAGQEVYFDYQSTSGFRVTPWFQVYDPSWNLPVNQYVGDAGPIRLPATGTYLFAIEGLTYDGGAEGTAGFQIRTVNDTTHTLSLGVVTPGSIDVPTQVNTYTFSLPGWTQLYFDALDNNGNVNWRLDGPSGTVIGNRTLSSGDSLLKAMPGDYRLVVWGTGEWTGGYRLFMRDMIASASAVPLNSDFQMTNAPASSASYRTFTGRKGQLLYVSNLGRGGFGPTPWVWLGDPYGNALLNQYYGSDSGTITLPFDGTYVLALEGWVYDAAPSGYAGFTLVTPTNTSAPLVLNTPVTGTLGTMGETDQYTFTLGSPTHIHFDWWTGGSVVHWALEGPGGRVGSADGSSDYGPLVLPAGNYTFSVWADLHATPSYSFLARDLSSVPVLPLGSSFVVTNDPPNRATIFRVAGNPGDRLYFNLLSRNTGAAGWTFTDPYDNRLFDTAIYIEPSPVVLPSSGDYFLFIAGANNQGVNPAILSLEVDPSPVGAIQNLLQPTLAPDLTIDAVAVTPATGVRSGSSIDVSWTEANSGSSPVALSWRDRVVVRSVSLNQVLFSATLPYDVSLPGNGPLGAGATLARHLPVALPDGPAGAGALEVIVTADYGNVVAEQNTAGTGEANNSSTLAFTSTLSNYPDLQVASIGTSPAPGWTGGSTVTLTWVLTNSGSAAVTLPFKDQVVMRNLTTGLLVTNLAVAYDPAPGGEGAILPGETRARNLTVVLPLETAAIGVFEVAVTTDSEDVIFEYATGRDAAANNQAVVQVGNASNLRVTGASAAPGAQAGADLVISWRDTNAGNTSDPRTFYDWVTVRNPALNDTLISVLLPYSPSDPRLGPIAPGTGVDRSYRARLPDGPRGAGDLEVTIVTDSQGAIPEFDGVTPAEGDNSSQFTLHSSLPPYPDLVVRNLTLTPASPQSGGLITVSWQDANVGAAPAPGAWSDRVDIVNTDRGQSLAVGNVYHDGSTLGAVPVGGSAQHQYQFRLPNGDPGKGNLRITVTTDYGGSVFEYTPSGQAEQNNSSSIDRTSTLALYPDLSVTELDISPRGLSSGRDVTVSWVVTNSGPGTVTGDFFDRVLVVNRTTTQTLLDVHDYLNPLADVNGPIGPGQSRLRQHSFRLPDGTAGAGEILFQVTTDDGNRVFEYLPGGDGETNNTASLTATSEAGSYPDLVLTAIQAPASGIPGQPVTLSWNVRNDGTTNTTGVWSDQVFLSADGVVGDDVSLGVFSVSAIIPPGQSIGVTQSVTLPFFATGPQRFVVRANSAQSFYEPNQANNLLMSPDPIQLAARLGVSASRTTFPESVGSVALTVTRNSDAGAPLTVALSSDKPGSLTVPASVVIPAGQTAATFPAQVVDNTIVDGTRVARVTATAPGVTSDTIDLSITDDDQPVLALRLTPSAVSEAAGAAAVVGYLTRNAGLDQPLSVTLVTSAPDKLVPPAVVVIPAGETVATFNVASLDNDLVEGVVKVTLQATAPGFTTASASVEFLDNDIPLLGITLAASAVNEGAASPATTGVVTRAPVTSHDLRVSLGYSPLGSLLLPPTVVIPAGQASAPFNVNVLDDTLVTGTRVVTLTAQPVSDLGAILTNAASVPLQIYDNDGPSLAISLANEVVSEQGSTLGTVTRNTPTAAPLVVSLASSDTTEATVPASVTIPAGAASATFTASGVSDGITDGVQYTLITASAAGFNSATIRLNVTDTDLPDLDVGNIIVPSSGHTDARAEVTWSVKNSGKVPAQGAWTDKVYISKDDQLGNDLLSATVPATGPLAGGASYTRTASIQLPSDPGTYHIIVVTDADGQVEEGSERNNVISLATIDVQPSYRATATAQLKVAPCGTPIPITGRAFFVDDNSPARYRLVTVRIHLRDTRRVFQVMADDKGEFSTTFTPLPTEAGLYTLGADHPLVQEDATQDTFTLLGFRADPGLVNVRLIPNEPLAGTIALQNLSDQPLSGLQASVQGAPAALGLQLSVPSDLPGGAQVPLQYSFNTTFTNPVSLSLQIRVSTAENVVKSVPLTIVVAPLRPVITVTPGYLAQGMVRGAQSLVSFDVQNAGGAPSGDLSVLLPPLPWMTLATPALIPSLPPGGRATVTLSLQPAADLPLARYDGSLAVGNTTAGVTIPYQFTSISEARGDARVTLTDEYTYFVNTAPHVTNATVALRDAISGEAVASMAADTNGVAAFSNLREGTYTVDAFAPKHSPFRGTLKVVAGGVAELEAFLSRQTVTYEWQVVPIDVQDQYKIVLQSVFETEVPIPNVVVEQPFLMPFVIEGATNQFNIKIRNEGLIAANGVRIDVPQDPRYIITPLVEEIGVLPAKSAMTIPVTIRVRDGSTPVAAADRMPHLNPQPRLAGGGGCEVEVHACLPNIPMGVHYYYVCGPNNVLQVRQIDLSPVCMAKDAYDCYQAAKGALTSAAEEGLANAACDALDALLTCAGANLSECQKAALQAACKITVGAATGGAAGAAAGAGSGAAGALGCVCSLLAEWVGQMSFAVPPPPGQYGPGWGGWGGVYFVPVGFPGYVGGGFGTSSCRPPAAPPAPGLAAIGDGPRLAAGGPGVCARVKLQIEQQATMTRAAFRGTLVVDNTGTAAIDGIRVTLDFRDEAGADASSRFVIDGPVLNGLNAVDGTGTIQAGGTGGATYTFLPTRDAAPDAPRAYRIGGTLRYIEDGQEVSVPMLSEPITVFPEARLALQYFQSRNVYSDDPFTDIIEPAEPFYLGLIVRNNGAGAARNFRITSAQPKIIENQKGLLISFKIIGSKVGASDLAPSLTADLGDIPAGRSQVAEWVLTSSLQGKFIDYSATFEHVNTLGSTNLSLIDGVEIHELIHPVLADRPGDDLIPDFLSNDIPDPDNFPDTLHMSDGLVMEVLPATAGKASGVISMTSRTVRITANQPLGWSFLELPDPGPGFRLWKVTRSDGKPLRVGDNVWTTDRTFPASIAGVVREHTLHLLDFNGTGDYTAQYRPDDSIPPSIASLEIVPPFPAGSPVTQVAITFSELVEPSTLDASDLKLSRNGELLGLPAGAVTFAQDGTNPRYLVTLPPDLTTPDGNYTLTLLPTGIEDLAGNVGTEPRSVSWARGANAPVVIGIGPVTPSIRNTPVGGIDVLFSRGIDPASFDRGDLILTRGGGTANLIDSSVTISSVSPDHYRIDGLSALSQSGGVYTLSVLGSGVQDPTGLPGVGGDSVTWTLLTDGPVISALETLTDNPRSVVVPSLDVTFSHPVDPASFTFEDVRLTRNGGPNLISSAVTVAQVTPTTFRVANFNWVVGQEGLYTFSVDASGVRDLAGNAGLGSVSESWTMDTTKPAAPSGLALVPDRGVSSTDLLINTLRPTLTGSLGEPGIDVKVYDLTTQRELAVGRPASGNRFSLPLDLQTPGTHRLRVYAVDAAANLSADATLGVFVDLVAPTAVVAAVSPNPRGTAVSSIDVQFSEPVNPGTFDRGALTLKRGAGANLVSPAVSVTPVSDTLFRVSGLSGITDLPGYYELSVNLAVVEDMAGNAGVGTAATTWSRTGPNSGPTLTPIPDYTAYVGALLSFTNSATDAELATQTLTYTLEPGAPDNAHLDPTTGVFSWRPTRSQAPGVYPITVTVTDSGVPSLADSRSFNVKVGDFSEVSLGDLTLEPGATGDLPIVLTSTAGVTNLSFDVRIPAGRLAGFSLVNLSPVVGAGTLQVTGADRIRVLLASQPGQAIRGSNELGFLRLTAASPQDSGFLGLPIEEVQTRKPNGDPVPSIFVHPGRVAVVGTLPLLEALTDEVTGERFLLLRAQVGRSYDIQHSETLGLGAPWLVDQRVLQTSLAQEIRGLGSLLRVVFYRAVPVGGDAPTLQAVIGPAGKLKLVIQGKVGATYQLLSSPTLGTGAIWSPVQTVPMPTPTVTLRDVPRTDGARFFRLETQ